MPRTKVTMGRRLTLLDPPEGAEESCYIETPLGVEALLRAVAAAGSRAAAYFDNGKRFIHTRLVAVAGKPQMLVFEKGADADLNAALLASARVTFVTSDDRVPVQFTCAGPALTVHEGSQAIHVALPGRVLRLQRRGYYRLACRPVHPLLRAELFPGNDYGKATKAWVFDLSCGGLAAGVLAAEPLLASDATHGFMLELPGQGRISAQVIVRVASGTILPNGLEGRRYGLEFVHLGDKSAACVQCYILEQQRSSESLEY
jgi:c-di-GMP-binding flagellar brake protein YcgR